MKATFATAVSEQDRPFRCSSCGHKATARIRGIGEGSATLLNITPDSVSTRRAQVDAARDVDRTLAIVRCPSCRARDGAAVTRWWLRHTVPLVLMFGLISFLGWLPYFVDVNLREADRPIAGWVMTGIGFFCCGLGFLISVLPKWTSVSARVTWRR